VFSALTDFLIIAKKTRLKRTVPPEEDPKSFPPGGTALTF